MIIEQSTSACEVFAENDFGNFARGDRPRDVLEKLELVRDGHPTWAAVLLFGKDPQSPLIQATVHCGRFRTEIDIVDNRMIEGSIIDQIDETMDFLKKHINVRFVITGKPRRDEIWDYPLQALREAVVNAICHRNYGDNSDIQIKVFDDHIRIWSPGLLPYGVTVQDLYRRTHTSKPRNKLIAQVFYDLEIIERYGSGIQRILDACRAAGIPKPTFEESTGGLLITFRRATSGKSVDQQKGPKVQSEVQSQDQVGTKSELGRRPSQPTQSADPVVRLLTALAGNELSSGQLRRALGIKHRPTFRQNYIHPAIAMGLIERTMPGKPNSRLQKYRLTVKGRAVIGK